jgi:hypothetical protein
MTKPDELKLRKLVESIGARSLYMQWARYYLRRRPASSDAERSAFGLVALRIQKVGRERR